MAAETYHLNLIKAIMAHGWIAQDPLKAAVSEARLAKKPLEEILRAKNLLDENRLAQVRAEAMGLQYIDLSGQKIDKALVEIIPQQLADKFKVLCFAQNGNVLSVAMVDPTNQEAREAVDFIGRQKGMITQYFLISEDNFKKALNQYGAVAVEVEEALAAAKEKIDTAPRKAKIAQGPGFEEAIKNAPVTKMVDIIIEQAVEMGASDIHIEPLFKETRVRFRVDGILRTFLSLPKYIHSGLISRIKVVANLKIDETRIPQDGRFRLTIAGKDIDFRVSTLPLVENEKVVMRILDTPDVAPTLEDLGFMGKALEVMNKRMQSARGIFLSTGPTGSGKTTTLYSILNRLNKESVNIVTLEDPIEYFLTGVNQSQIRPDVGFTFASGLRSILRQDPNVVMVGEIRDNETAELAIHAGLTGHVVLSTLHTSDSFGAIPRLLDMNVEPFLLTSTMNVVVGQRLARKICPNCKKEIQLAPEVLAEVKAILEKIPNLKEHWPGGLENLKFYAGAGCPQCGETGYKGRVAVVEVLPVTDEIKKIVLARGTDVQIHEEFSKLGLLTMNQDGIIKTLMGLTTIEEIMRVTRE